MWALRLAPHLLLGDLLVRKQLVNVPVVLKAPGKKAGHAWRSSQPNSSAQHGVSSTASKELHTGAAHLPTLVATDPGWVPSPGGRGPHGQAIPTPLSAKRAPAFSLRGLGSSAAGQEAWPREPQEADLQGQLTWPPRACLAAAFCSSPLPLPRCPPCAVSPPSPQRPAGPASPGGHIHTACLLLGHCRALSLPHDACPRRRVSERHLCRWARPVSGGGRVRATRSLLWPH